MAPRKPIQPVLQKLAAAERQFLAGEFLAPAVAGGQVRVRIAGVVCHLTIEPPDFQGWGVFRPASYTAAQLIRAASLSERQRYLELFPLVRLIVCSAEGGRLTALPAHQGDTRFRIQGMVPLQLAEEVQLFDAIRARFDGAQFWFEALDPARDPAAAAYLRRTLQQMTDPNQLDRPGLTPEERAAYALNYLPRLQAQLDAHRDRTERRLSEALAHAGADLVDYLERRDSFRVTYTVDGRTHVSAIDKRDLTVQVAGICLSDQDRRFDLQSLVGVLREADE